MNNGTAREQFVLHRVEQVAQARDEAVGLLARLLSDRRQSEQRCAEAGMADPLKNVTGASALDRAVTTTRGLIQHMDELIGELTADGPTIVTTTGEDTPSTESTRRITTVSGS